MTLSPGPSSSSTLVQTSAFSLPLVYTGLDIKGRKLLDPLTSVTTKGQVTHGESTQISLVKADHQFSSLLKSFPTLTQPLTSDRGSQFESSMWNKVMSLLGIQRFRTASYHPQANGTVERFHRQLKSSLAASATRADWSQALPLVLLGIRTSLKEDLHHSSAEL
ncbi:uncharacterized protein LOC135098869, partial [Scylla paramamosain]|uniref:uncharacterized protein LOC135098869 n=1 Tax=Scylla paramamosain TaxID=85552 RepID=UPI0030836CE5